MIFAIRVTPWPVDAGAGLRELMDRMGHSTARAAMIYLHGTDERQQAIADALSQFTIDALKRRPVGDGAHSGHGSGGTLREDHS